MSTKLRNRRPFHYRYPRRVYPLSVTPAPILVTDDFNRANNDAVGAPWVERSGDWDISSNGVIQTDAGSVPGLLLYDVPIAADHWIECTLAVSDGSGQIGLSLRCHPTVFTCLNLEVADGAYKVIEVTAGTPNTVSTGSAHTHATGDRFRAETEGTATRLYLNDTLVHSFTTSFQAGATRAGLHINESTSGAIRWDNFRAGTLPFVAGGTSAPAENATATGVANAPTLTLAANAPAEAAASTGTAFDPTVSAVGNTNAPAEAATATGTAFDATVSTSGGTMAAAGHAAATGVAETPALTLAANALAEQATSTGAAADPTVTLAEQALAELAAAIGTAFDPTPTSAANALAGLAAATGAAFDATVSTAAMTNAPAEAANATATAFDPTSSGTSAALAGLTTAIGQAFGITADIGASAGSAASTGTAPDPTVQISVFALIDVATATGQAFDIAVAPPVPVPPTLVLAAITDRRTLTALPDDHTLVAITEE